MGDLPEVIGKDDQKYNNSEDEHKLAAGKHDQTPILVFNLVLGLFLTFLFCYMNLGHLIAMAILVFSALILKEQYTLLHNSGGHHTPEIPNEDQQNKHEHKADEPETESETENKDVQEILQEIEDVKNSRQEADKYCQVDDGQKLEIDRMVVSLQAGYDWEYEVSSETIQARNEHKKKRKNKNKKKKKKADGIVEGILEGVLETTNVVIDISTGGLFSSTIGYIFWR